MKNQRKKKDPLEAEINKYKFKRIGIIKSISFGLLPGTRFGAFAWMNDGGFGLSLSIIDVENTLPLHYVISAEKCEQFFRDMGIIWHTELKGKHVLLLSNSDAVCSVEKVVAHKKLLESLKSDLMIK